MGHADRGARREQRSQPPPRPAARQFLASTSRSLAPGATVDGLHLLANRVDGNAPHRDFAQHADGLRVLGGAIGFTFSHDRLVMVSSTALPNVEARCVPGGSLSPATLASSATRWLAQDGYAVDVKAHGERVIVPIVHARGNASAPQITYRVAEELTVESSRELGALGRLARRGAARRRSRATRP